MNKEDAEISLACMEIYKKKGRAEALKEVEEIGEWMINPRCNKKKETKVFLKIFKEDWGKLK